MDRQPERDPEIALQNVGTGTNSDVPVGTSAQELHFEDTSFPNGGEDPPPEFTVYEPECSVTFSGDVLSHDKHLNEDGEALYRFLLSQGQTLPDFRLRCTGTHTETRRETHTVSDGRGGTTTRSSTRTVTVTDFSFTIDLTQYIVLGPRHWSAADDEPAFRGGMIREVQKPDPSAGVTTRKATSAEKVEFDDWTTWRIAHGLPPWIASDYKTQNPELTLRSSRTLRQWADEYCASKKYLKEFIYKKEVYGWDREYVRSAITTIIRQTGYRSTITVNFVSFSAKVYIRPDNALSRASSKTWIKILLWLFLIYPFIWLYKHFNSRGGGRWKVCGGAYALKYWQRVDNPDGPGAFMHPVGYREQDWVQHHADIIRTAVLNRIVD